MSKAVKSITKTFTGLLGGGFEQPKAQRVPSQDRGMTPEEMAERRAAAAASGRKIEEENMGTQMESSTRWLQRSNSSSSFWT